MNARLSKNERAGVEFASDSCACFNLRKAARAVTRQFDEALQPTGLRSTQAVILVELARRGPMPLGQFADAMVMDKSTLSRKLKLLRGKGLIVMKPGTGRQKLVSISDQGIQTVREIIPFWRIAQKQFLQSFGEEGWDAVLPSLTKIAAPAAA